MDDLSSIEPSDWNPDPGDLWEGVGVTVPPLTVPAVLRAHQTPHPQSSKDGLDLLAGDDAPTLEDLERLAADAWSARHQADIDEDSQSDCSTEVRP